MSTVKSNITSLVNSMAYSKLPLDKNDVFQLRSLIRGTMDKEYVIHENSMFISAVTGLGNVRIIGDDESHMRSDFPRDDYKSRMNRIIFTSRGCAGAASLRNFVMGYYGDKDRLISHVIETTARAVSRDIHEEKTIDVLNEVVDLVLLYQEYRLQEKEGIKSIIIPLSELISKYGRNEISKNQLDISTKYIDELIHELPHKVDELSILMIMIVSKILSKDITVNNIIFSVKNAMKRKEDNSNENIFLSGLYDNPLIKNSDEMKKRVEKSNDDNKIEIKSMMLHRGIKEKPSYLSINNIENDQHKSIAELSLTDIFILEEDGRKVILTKRDRFIAENVFRSRYKLFEGKTPEGERVLFAELDRESFIGVIVKRGKQFQILQLGEGSRVVGVYTYGIKGQSELTDDTVTEAIRFSKDGDIHFTRLERENLIDEFNRINRLANIQLRSENKETEPMKTLMVDLFALILYVERKYMGHRKIVLNRKNYDTALQARMYAIGTFNRLHAYVMEEEPNFDFSKYFVENNNSYISYKIGYEELLGIRKLLGVVLAGM